MNALYKAIDSRWPSPTLVPVGFVFCLILLLVQTLPAAVLTHRYPFDTNAADVVGGADGILQGNAFVTNGAVVFDGVNSGVHSPPTCSPTTTASPLKFGVLIWETRALRALSMNLAVPAA